MVFESLLALPLWAKIVSSIGVGLGICKLIFASPRRPNLEKKLAGQVVVVTGSNTGIGFATVQLLAQSGAKIILACRNKEKTEKAIKDILEKTGNPTADLEFMKLDLSDLK